MSRIKVTQDGELAGWFDPDKATVFKEAQWHDGNNFISKATGSQTEHECLWYTAGGTWILNRWSQYQGSRETYEVISARDAAEWFLKNEYQESEIEGLPDNIHREIMEVIGGAEL